MVAGHVDNFRADFRLAEDGTDHVVVSLRPVTALLQLPDVDDVADEVKRFAFRRLEKSQQRIGIAAPESEVHIRHPDAAKPAGTKVFKAAQRTISTSFGETSGEARQSHDGLVTVR